MASPGMPGTSKLSSTINITIAAPTFYSPQKKFAPVVAPKPKANPYKASSRPEPAPPVTALPSASSSRAWLGRVGDPPAAGLGDDLPLPPPPPADEGHLPPPGYIPPPPPPPPPPFEDSFPPPPVEETFPSPPPPLEEEPPAADWSRDTEAAGSSSLDAGSSFESQIDTLNSMLNEMQNNDPYKAKVAPAAPGVNGNVGVSVRQGPASDSPPGAPASSRFGPRVAGVSPVKAPKPQAVGPKPQPGPPPASWAGPAKQRLPEGGPPAPSPPAPAQDRAAPPAGEGGPGNKRHQHSEGPAEQPKSTRNRAEQKEEPRVQEHRDRGPGFLSSKGDDNPAPFTYKDVEELENLTKQFMQEMDKNPKNSTGRTEICSRCRKELSRTEPAVKAMGKMFHVSCFLCNSCHQELKGQQFYEVDGEPLCEGCHSSTLEKCDVCHQPITERMLKATGRNYHPKCFTCTECHKRLEGQPFIVDQETKVYCVQDYHRKFAPRCSVCDEPIIPEEGKEESVRIIALNKNFHVKCYRCEDCKKQLSSEANEDGCYPLDDHILCLKCHTSRVNKGLRD